MLIPVTDQCNDIERKNKMLLQKMTEILTTERHGDNYLKKGGSIPPIKNSSKSKSTKAVATLNKGMRVQ
jgi:hypothetical protein